VAILRMPLFNVEHQRTNGESNGTKNKQ
jgi:hypothetical protein